MSEINDAEARRGTVILNFAVLPPPSVSDVVVSVSRQLANAHGLFTVDGNTRVAHLTLYMARFPVAAVSAVCDRASELVERIASINVAHTGYYLTPGNYYEVSYSAGGGLQELHESATAAIQAMRYSPGAPIREDYFGPYSPEQQHNARESGYDLAGALFRPHITITRFASPPQICLPTPEVDLSFDLDRLAIYRADHNGALVERIAGFRIPVASRHG